MDFWTFIFLTILVIHSIKATLYLFLYVTLTKAGSNAKAKIVSFEISRSITNKNAAIPTVSFMTHDNGNVTCRPLLSWHYPINDYAFKKECVVFYDIENPTKFIVKSNPEFAINILVIIVTIFVFAYLIIFKY